VTIEQVYYTIGTVVLVVTAAWGSRWIWKHPAFQGRRSLLAALKTMTKRAISLERENKENRLTMESFDRSFKRLHDEIQELRDELKEQTSKSRAQIVYIVQLLFHIDGGGGKESIPQPPDDLKDDVDEALQKARGLVHLGGQPS
jgi:TolA-binding protein